VVSGIIIALSFLSGHVSAVRAISPKITFVADAEEGQQLGRRAAPRCGILKFDRD